MNFFVFLKNYVAEKFNEPKPYGYGLLYSGEVTPWLVTLASRMAALPDIFPSETFLVLDQEIRSWRINYLSEKDSGAFQARLEQGDNNSLPSPLRPCPSRLLSTEQEALYISGLYSMASNGFERERHVAFLSRISSREAVPFLLMRSCDWVPSVRSLALDALFSLLREKDAACFFLPFSGLIHRLESFSRYDKRLGQKIRTCFAHVSSSDDFYNALKNAHLRDRRALFEFSSTWSTERRMELARFIFETDPDGVMRCRAAAVLLENTQCEERAGWLRRFVADRLSRLSMQALRAALAADLVDLDALLTDSLFHHSVSIQKMAAFYLEKRTGIKAASLYRQELAYDRGRHKAALTGLIWCGDKSDALAAQNFLSRDCSALYGVALRLLYAHDAKNRWREILSHVTGKNQHFRAIALRVLARYAPDVDEDLVWPIFTVLSCPITAQRLFRVMLARGHWNSLRVIIRAFQIPLLPEVANEAFTQWYRNYKKIGGIPPAFERTAILEALHEAVDYVPSHIQRCVREVLN